MGFRIYGGSMVWLVSVSVQGLGFGVQRDWYLGCPNLLAD